MALPPILRGYTHFHPTGCGECTMYTKDTCDHCGKSVFDSGVTVSMSDGLTEDFLIRSGVRKMKEQNFRNIGGIYYSEELDSAACLECCSAAKKAKGTTNAG